MNRSCLFGILLAGSLAAQVTLKQAPGSITVDIGGKPFTTLNMGSEVNKPYFYPVRSASGKMVTRNYPMEQVAGERKDHPHQRSMWFSHGDVNGYDFWANEKSQWGPKKGRIVLKKVLEAKSGSKSGRLAAIFDWLDNSGSPLLTQTERVTFYNDPKLRIMDFDILLTPVVKVTFGDTKEGTFALRLAAPLEEPSRGAPAEPKRTGLMVNAEGAQGERNVWGKRSNWVDYFGEIDGEPLGVAILDHPGNPRHPTWWHSRSYGLFAANPFGEHDFEHLRNDPHKGDLTVEPGKHLRFRYRVIIHPGDYKSADIAAEYAKYAKMK